MEVELLVFLIVCAILFTLDVVVVIINLCYPISTRRGGSFNGISGHRKTRCFRLQSTLTASILHIYASFYIIANLYNNFVSLVPLPGYSEARLLRLPGIFFHVSLWGCSFATLFKEERTANFVWSVFECFHFVLFWCSLTLKVTYADLDSGSGVIVSRVILFSYIFMLLGALRKRKHYRTRELTSPEEAIQTIEGTLNRTPSIKWTIEVDLLSKQDTGEESGTFLKCQFFYSKCYEFQSDDIRRTVNLANISQDVFKYRFTELTIWTIDDVELNSTTEKYIVMRDADIDDPTYLKLKDVLAVVDFFMILGLSIPYRLLLYYFMGHVNVKNHGRVYGEGEGEGFLPDPPAAELAENGQNEIQTTNSWIHGQNEIPINHSWIHGQNEIPTTQSLIRGQNEIPTTHSWTYGQNEIPTTQSLIDGQNEIPTTQSLIDGQN